MAAARPAMVGLFEIGRENRLSFPPAEPLGLGDDEAFFPLKAIGVAVRAGGDLGGQDGFAAVANLVLAGIANDLPGALQALISRFNSTYHNSCKILQAFGFLASIIINFPLMLGFPIIRIPKASATGRGRQGGFP